MKYKFLFGFNRICVSLCETSGNFLVDFTARLGNSHRFRVFVTCWSVEKYILCEHELLNKRLTQIFTSGLSRIVQCVLKGTTPKAPRMPGYLPSTPIYGAWGNVVSSPAGSVVELQLQSTNTQAAEGQQKWSGLRARGAQTYRPNGLPGMNEWVSRV